MQIMTRNGSSSSMSTDVYGNGVRENWALSVSGDSPQPTCATYVRYLISAYLVPVRPVRCFVIH